MKNYLTCLFFLSICSLFAIEGTYTVTGMDPYVNNSYTGTAVITKDKNNVYQAQWMINGEAPYKGTGILQNNEVSFIFVNETNKGVQMYQVKGDTLEGAWVYLGKSLVGSEKMVKK